MSNTDNNTVVLTTDLVRAQIEAATKTIKTGFGLDMDQVKIPVLKSAFNCRIKCSYPAHCEAGKLCKPIESSFVTECEVPGCKKFM